MRILMLGNSYTFCNDLPKIVSELTGAEVVQHTRGGARLREHLNPRTEMGKKTLAALQNEQWDYVVLQEMSNAPITSHEAFFKSAAQLCALIHSVHATPVFFATWAYQKDSARMAKMRVGYDVMAAQLSAAYHEAAEQNDALLADAGRRFYQLSRTANLYSPDGSHPNEQGSREAAKVIADIILSDQNARKNRHIQSTAAGTSPSDPRLRILYLYLLLLRRTDPEHPLSTNQIMEIMETEHGIRMHRTTVPSDVALLQAAGIPVHARRSSAMLYYMEESRFEIPELKILIDAVESSKFITEKKCRRLVEKLTTLTSQSSAEKLKRNLHISGRVRSGNEKGYYIVDAINEAINEKKPISFLYTEYNGQKELVLRNSGNPYIVSPYILIWNGDFYYLVGWYHAKQRITTFRVDRILNQPEILPFPAFPVPDGFDVSRYTREVFRMFDNQETRQVTLLCENSIMKGVLDQFGTNIDVTPADDTHFITRVNVCTSQTFYGWVFQWRGAVRILDPPEALAEYRDMARTALE